MSQVQVSAEHDAFLVSLNPDRSAALAEVLDLYMAMLRQAKAAEIATRANGSLFPDAPGHRTRKPPTGPAAELVEWFVRAWAHHRDGDVYCPQKRDFISAAKLLQSHPGPEGLREIRFRADNMLMREDKFWLERASLYSLESQWNGLRFVDSER